MDRETELREYYATLMNYIIDFNLVLRDEQHKDLKNMLSNFQYAKEYCTVKFDIGRQVGKSRYIFNNASPECIVFAINLRIANDCFGGSRAMIRSVNQNLDYIELKGMRPKRIYIDDASCVHSNTIDKIYEKFADKNVKDQTFILLG